MLHFFSSDILESLLPFLFTLDVIWFFVLLFSPSSPIRVLVWIHFVHHHLHKQLLVMQHSPQHLLHSVPYKLLQLPRHILHRVPDKLLKHPHHLVDCVLLELQCLPHHHQHRLLSEH